MTQSIRKFHLANAGVFEKLPLKERIELEAGMLRKKAKKGKLIYREGSFPKGVYILLKGKVKIFQTTGDGREQILYIYSAGDMMGYRPLISNESHPVSAVALEECTFQFIPKEKFLRLLANSHELARILLISLSREFSVWVNNITVFAQQPVKVRVAIGLLVLQEKFRVKGKIGEINLSRDDFAGYLGTVKETLVRVLQEFKKKGYVETQGRKIRILNQAALAEIADYQ